MKKSLGMKILLQNPLKVIMEGIRIKQQEYYKNAVKSEYGIDQLRTIDILDLFKNIDESINTYSFLYGTSLVTDLLLLKLLSKRFDQCAFLEIGSWRGESIANVNDVTTDCTSLTLSNQQMRELNFDEKTIEIHGFFSNHIKSIKKIEANSFTFDFTTLDKKYDLVFIDGDHSYDGVLNDTKKVLPILKNEKSIIVWHDYNFDPELVRHSTLKAILDGIPKDKHKNLYHISNTMCAVYMEDIDIPTTFTSIPSYPNKNFKLTIKAERV